METNRKSIFGIALIILGIYFLLENLDVIDIDLPWYFFTWQMLLIALGFFNLFTGNRKAALILLSIGIFFFLPEFYDFDIRDYWPILLIFIGLSFLFRNKITPSSAISDASAFDDFTLFGSNEKAINSAKFLGGKTITIFGSTQLDFRETQLGGGEAVVEAFTLFGSTELIIPRDWEVLSEVTPILGAFEDKRGDARMPETSKKLIINGLVVFGSVEIRS